MTQKPMTPQQFHEMLQALFAKHLEAVRAGTEKQYSFLKDEGINYNDWIEHRHGWPLTEDLLCGPAMSSWEDLDDPNSGSWEWFEDCGTCSALVRMYRQYCEETRLKR